MARDYIPRRDADFNVFFKNITQYVAQKTTGSPPAWPHILAADIAALNQSYANWYTAYAVTLQPHTRAQKNEKNRVRLVEERNLREFVNMYLRHRPVTDFDRDSMGIPNPDTTRTDHVEVTETVDYVLHLRDIREIIVDFWISGADHKAKPTGYDGAVIVYDVRETPPASPDELNRHTLASRTPFALRFTEEERGKTVYVALAWQNERGILGAYSEIKTAVIP